MKWISVKDRLPEIGKEVLMRVSVSNYYNVEQGTFKGGTEWVNCWCSKRNANLYPITHWMPLPEPPKEIKMIENNLGCYVVTCDECGHEQEFDIYNNWAALIIEMREDDWINKKINDEWYNFCGHDCASKHLKDSKRKNKYIKDFSDEKKKFY